MTKADPRLFVLMRPEADHAVVLRQGPSKVFCTLGWNLETDKLAVGQWVKHKIYVERCDISSTGKYLVYFALNGRWSSEAEGAWTAVSLAPYLRALKLWPLGNTWGGGGLFYRDRTKAPKAIADGWDELDDFEGDRLASGIPKDRFLRDGWMPVSKGKGGVTKPITKGWTLEAKNVDGPTRYALIEDGTAHARPGWTWADVDSRRERLLWGEGGVLYQAAIKPSALGEPSQIFDARPMMFEPIAAPYENETIIVRSGAR